MRSPTLSFLAGRTSARQRLASTRLISVASTLATASPRTRIPVEPRRDHPRVVDDQRVAGAEEIRQIADAAVGERAVRADHQHPRRIARNRRRQRDALGRQVEIEQVDAHA